MCEKKNIVGDTCSISVVVYKPCLKVLGKALLSLTKSIRLANSHRFKIYLIDNDESHTDIERFRHMLHEIFLGINNIFYSEVIAASQNLGYGYGHNLAINKSDLKYHLVLNPDVFVEDNALSHAIDYMGKHPKVGLLTPAVFGENGERHCLCKRNPTLLDAFLRIIPFRFIKQIFRKRMQRFEMRDKDYDREIMDVPFATGCFMFFRTSVLKKLQGFDEDFFMYYEDADICRRLLRTSHSAYVPSVKIVHKWDRSSHKNWKMCRVHIKSAFIYWKKWGGIL